MKKIIVLLLVIFIFGCSKVRNPIEESNVIVEEKIEVKDTKVEEIVEVEDSKVEEIVEVEDSKVEEIVEVEDSNTQAEENTENETDSYQGYFSLKNWIDFIEINRDTLGLYGLYNNCEKIKSVKLYKMYKNNKVLYYEEEWDNGKIVKRGNPDADFASYDSYVYDEKDRLISIHTREYNGRLYEVYRFVYSYDEEKNTVICRRIDSKGNEIIYKEKIVPGGFSYEKYQNSSVETETFIFENNLYTKYIYISPRLSSRTEFEYYDDKTVALNYIDDRLSSKQIVEKLGDFSTLDFINIVDGEEHRSSPPHYLKNYDKYGNWTEMHDEYGNIIYREFEYNEDIVEENESTEIEEQFPSLTNYTYSIPSIFENGIYKAQNFSISIKQYYNDLTKLKEMYENEGYNFSSSLGNFISTKDEIIQNSLLSLLKSNTPFVLKKNFPMSVLESSFQFIQYDIYNIGESCFSTSMDGCFLDTSFSYQIQFLSNNKIVEIYIIVKNDDINNLADNLKDYVYQKGDLWFWKSRESVAEFYQKLQNYDPSLPESLIEFQKTVDCIKSTLEIDGKLVSFTPTEITIQTEAVVNDDNVRLRSAPFLGEESQVITVLMKNQKVKILSEGYYQKIDGFEAPWYKIQTSDNKTGWIYGGYLSK